eukprot:365549-Chlamydomonas_euryale.AAC.7
MDARARWMAAPTPPTPSQTCDVTHATHTIDARMLAKVSHAEYDMPRSVTEPSSGPRSCTRL